MSSWQTVRLVLLMLLVGGVSVASYVFYEHQLHFCVFFSLVIVLVIITHLVYVYSRSIRRMSRMIESIRYGDFTLSFTAPSNAPSRRTANVTFESAWRNLSGTTPEAKLPRLPSSSSANI